MGRFSDGFWNRAGRNTADFASNVVFGDKWARPFKRVGEEAQADAIRQHAEGEQIKAQAIANEYNTRARLAERNHLNAIEAAVRDDIEKVIAFPFAEDPGELSHQLNGLAIQLSANAFTADTEEEKIRTKFTEAVYQKFKQGLSLLLVKNPYDANVAYLYDVYLKATKERRKHKLSTFYWILGCVLGLGLICGFCLMMDGMAGFFVIALAATALVGIIWLIVIIARSIANSNRLKNARAAFDVRPKASVTEHKPVAAAARPVVEPKEPETPAVAPAAEVASVEAPVYKEEEKSLLQTEYDKLWEQWGASHPILKRGYKVAVNDEQKDIFILGFNPRLIGNGNSSTFRFPDVEHPYPYLVKHMLVSDQNDLMGRSTYLDMFGFKEPNHEVAMQNIICNPKVFGYVAAQVALTQDVIEDVIRPKLIVILDQDIWAFFGKVKGLTWMGYSFKAVSNVNGYELCEITGFSKAKDRISQDSRLASTLVGTKVLFTDGKHVSKFPKPDDILKYIS